MAKKDIKGITVKKDEDFSEWFTQVIQKAELADIRYNVKGFPVYLPWAAKSINKIRKHMEDTLEKKDHQPLIMPSLIPESNFQLEADHVEGFAPEVFWVTHGGDTKLTEKLALRPTSETALYQMYSLWIRSHNDLPLKRYQSCQVWRYEGKMTRPFFRTRELYWSEAHNVFANEKEALAQVKEDMETTKEHLTEFLGVPFIFFQRPAWDKFGGAVNTYAADALMGSGKVLQLPSTHNLGTNFSKPFNVKYIDDEGKEQLGWITCYGPCHSRNYGALIALHGDDKGLVLPWGIAPKHIVIVPIYKDKSKKTVLKYCKDLEKDLKEKTNFEIFIDNRENYSPGWKFNEWELKGVPIRIEVGEREIEDKKVVLYRRDVDEKKKVDSEKLIDSVLRIGNSFTKSLYKKASKNFQDNTKECKNISEIDKAIKSGKMARACFCSVEKDGEPCAEKIEKEVGAFVRGIRFDEKKEDLSKKKCAVCGSKANCIVYIAKSY